MNLPIAIGLVSVMGAFTLWHIIRTIRSGVKDREWEIRKQVEEKMTPNPTAGRKVVI